MKYDEKKKQRKSIITNKKKESLYMKHNVKDYKTIEFTEIKKSNGWL